MHKMVLHHPKSEAPGSGRFGAPGFEWRSPSYSDGSPRGPDWEPPSLSDDEDLSSDISLGRSSNGGVANSGGSKRVERTLTSARNALMHFSIARKVEPRLMGDVRDDLEAYLEAVDELQAAVDFFTDSVVGPDARRADGSRRNTTGSEAALSFAAGLLGMALSKLEEEFRDTILDASAPGDRDGVTSTSDRTGDSHEDDSGLGRGRIGRSGAWEKVRGAATSEILSSMETMSLEDRGSRERRKSGGPVPGPVVKELQEIAARLARGGRGGSCVDAYLEARMPVLEESLAAHGLVAPEKGSVNSMAWPEVEADVAAWVGAVGGWVEAPLAYERELCDRVMRGIDVGAGTASGPGAGEQVFSALADPSIQGLLRGPKSFGEALPIRKRSPESLFALLDLWGAFADTEPSVRRVLAGEACRSLRDSFRGMMEKLARAARETFAAFEEAVEKEKTAMAAVAGAAIGGVHPLTSYVMNYLKFVLDYKDTFGELFAGLEREVGRSALDVGKGLGTHLGAALTRITAALQTNLEAKAKGCADRALGHIFLMNNMHFMVEAVKKSELKEVLGSDWLHRERRVVQQQAYAYRQAAWGEVLPHLRLSDCGVPGLTGGSNSSNGSSSAAGGSVARAVVKAKLQEFRTAFAQLYDVQSKWNVPSPELREELRIASGELLLPAYRSFLSRAASALESKGDMARYVKWTPEDLEEMLGDLFEGKAPA